MNHDLPNPYTRREMLRTGLLLASASLTIPAFLERSALAMQAQQGGLSGAPGVPEERILVVLQLSGGNDGLNTVVPAFAPEYYNLRKGIAIPEKEMLLLDKQAGVGLHPSLAGFKDLFDQGLMGLVQGAGYPNPNRSHFKSMDIWQTADTTATGNGWLGRYLDSECCGFGKNEGGKAARSTGESGPPAIAIGRNAPLAMEGSLVKPVAFEDPNLFRWSGKDIDQPLASAYDDANRRDAAAPQGTDNNSSFLLRTALDAQVSSDLIRKAVATKPQTSFPQNELSRQLAMVASMIRANLKTRVYYVSYGGFDTHAGQGGANGRHANLLKVVGDSMKAFYAELKLQNNDARVMTMSFSEFGRRVGQNASGGTDHGTAAPMFLFGPMVQAGVLTSHPSLRDLDEGDLRFTTDFRRVYAGVLGQWLKADAAQVLEGSYKAMRVVRA
jgi:uncharacterized protein (DUF1501 family)